MIQINVLVPMQLANIFNHENATYINFGVIKTFIQNDGMESLFDRCFDDLFGTLNGLLIYGLKNNKFSVEEIKSWFEFETEELKNKFHTKFDELKSYECLDEIAM
jgi:hypothetical protein